MSDRVPWGDQDQTGPSAGPPQPGWWDKFQAARDKSARRSYNFFRQAFTGHMPDTPLDKMEAEYAKRYHDELSSVIGHYVGAAEDPQTVAMMAYMMFGGPAAGAFKVEQEAQPLFEEEAEPAAKFVVKKGEELGERVLTEAKRAAVLSQMHASDEPLVNRLGEAGSEMLTSVPFALTGMEPGEASEYGEELIHKLAEFTPGEAERILPSGTRIARGISQIAGAIMPSLREAGVDLGEGIMGGADDLLKHIIRQTGRRVLFQMPKQFIEQESGKAVDWGEEKAADLDPGDLHSSVYRAIQGRVRREGGLTPWEYLDTARDIHGAKNYDSDNIPDDALAEKNEAQMVMRQMLHKAMPSVPVVDPEPSAPPPPHNELALNQEAWRPSIYTGLPSPDQLRPGASSMRPWYQQPLPPPEPQFSLEPVDYNPFETAP